MTPNRSQPLFPQWLATALSPREGETQLLKRLIKIPVLIIVPATALTATLIMGQAAAFATPTPAPQSGGSAHGHARYFSTRAVRVRTRYSVRSGDTLAKIAKRVYGSADRWPALWWANRSHVHNPNDIRVGQTLHLWRWHPQRAWLTAKAIGAIPKPKPAPAVVTSAQKPASSTPAPDPGGSVNPGDYSGFQACVIERESGGNAQVMNSSGHYGLYQFSYSTWVAAGGAGGDFGHAPVGEQNQVFSRAFAMWGTSPWAPSDGC